MIRVIVTSESTAQSRQSREAGVQVLLSDLGMPLAGMYAGPVPFVLRAPANDERAAEPFHLITNGDAEPTHLFADACAGVCAGIRAYCAPLPALSRGVLAAGRSARAQRGNIVAGPFDPTEAP